MKELSRYRCTILDRISFGISRGFTLEGLCGVDGIPSLATLERWARHDPDGFGAAFWRGRIFDLQARLDALVEVADDSRNDWRPRSTSAGAGAVFDPDNVAHARLHIRAHGSRLARAMARAGSMSADPLAMVLETITARATSEDES